MERNSYVRPPPKAHVDKQIPIKNAVRSREGEQHGCNSTQSERLHLIKQDSNLQKNEN